MAIISVVWGSCCGDGNCTDSMVPMMVLTGIVIVVGAVLIIGIGYVESVCSV